MRLLIITQKVNSRDPILGFFVGWIRELSRHFENITVICLEKGEYDLPRNVSVHSLGKEKGSSRVKILVNFYLYVFRFRKKYDSVFVHMNPIYVVLAGLLWRFVQRKKIFLWYTHKHVDWKLKIAEKLSSAVFTASPESFRLKSSKVVVTGHGIDTSLFKPSEKKLQQEKIILLTIGRISESKNYEVLVDSVRILKDAHYDVELLLVGVPVLPEDIVYEKKIKQVVQEQGLEEEVQFVGPISNEESVGYYQSANMFVHSSETGSLDKVVLEAMSCGVPVLSSNDASVPILSKFDSHLVFKKNDAEQLSENIIFFSSNQFKGEVLKNQFRKEVLEYHSLPKLIKKISTIIYEK